MIFKTVGDIIDLSLVKNLIQKSNWSKSLFSLNTFHVLTSYIMGLHAGRGRTRSSVKVNFVQGKL